MDFRAYEATPGISVIVLPDAPVYTHVAVSNDFIQFTGMKREEVIGKGHFEVFPKSPDDPAGTGEQALKASFEYILQNKVPHEIPLQRYDIPNSDGTFTIKYWKTNNAPILSKEGEVLYIVHSAVDITEQVMASQKVEAVKGMEKAYHLFMGAPVIIGILKGDDYVIDLANEGLLEVWGRTEEVIGQPLLKAIPELEAQGFTALLDQVRTTGEPFYAYEYPITLMRNGKKEVLYFDFIYKPFYEPGTSHIASGVFSVGHDVTEQVRTRQKFKNVVQQAPDPILILKGEDMVLEVANEALFRIWNTDKTAIGKPFLEILPEMKDQGFLELLQKVYHTGETFHGFQTPAVFREDNGGTRTVYFNFTYQPYQEADGSITGVLVIATDVTGQVLANQHLIESERNLRNIIQQSPVAMCIFRGPLYVVEAANDRMFELWGKTSDELLAKPIFDGLPEARHQGLEELLFQVYTTGETFAASERPILLPRNGVVETVYINFVYEPFREGDGTISGIIAVAIDVTEQVRARKKVEESEQKLRSLVESAPFPIAAYIGKEMRIEMANQSIMDIWGKGNDVVGKLYADILPELDNQEVFSQLERVYATGIPFHAKHQRLDLIVGGKPKIYYFNYSFTPLFDANGRVYGVMNTGADVTDLNLAKQQVEQSERNFRSMIVQAPVAMCILLGPEHVVDIANDAMIELWGKPVEDVIRRPIFEGLPDAREQGLEKLLADVYHTGIPFRGNEHPVQLVRKGKEETVYQNFVYEPYLDADGKILGVLAISVDVTAQVLARQKIEEVVVARTQELAYANEALVKSNQELKRSNANLEEFAYAASHDMKEPIRKIHIFSDRLKTELIDKLTDSQRHLFERLEHAAKRMSTLIDDLLMYSQATKGIASQEVINLNKKVQLVLEDLEVEIQEKKAEITIEPLPAVRGNRRQLQQLFLNLISNALKYNKPGMVPEIHIASQKVMGIDVRPDLPVDAGQKMYHLIQVRDKGIGFEQKDAERIFHVFTRLHGNTEYRGTGVGLSIVQKVVENHNGYIWAKSELGQGATFNVLLPYDPSL